MITKENDLIQKLIIGFLLIPFFIPNIVGSMPELKLLELLTTYWRLLSILLGCVLFVVSMVKGMYKTFIPSMTIILYILLAISTGINDKDILHALYYLFQIVAIVSISYYYGVVKNNGNDIFKVLYVYFSILVVLNLFSMFYIDTVDGWVFSNKNNVIYYLIPYLFFSILRNRDDGCSYKCIIFPFIISAFSIIVGQSTTSLFSLVFGFFLFFIFKRWNSNIGRKVLIIFFVSLLISYIIIVLNIVVYLDYIIAYFEKEESFGRFQIWAFAIDSVKDNPYLGVGLETIEDMKDNIGFSHCHNKYLDVTYLIGGFGLSLFLLLIYKVSLSIENIFLPKRIYVASFFSLYAIEFLMEGKRIDLMFYFLLMVIYIVSESYRKKYDYGTICKHK